MLSSVCPPFSVQGEDSIKVIHSPGPNQQDLVLTPVCKLMSAETLNKPVLPRSDSSTTTYSVKRPLPGRSAFLGNIWKSPLIIATDEISCLSASP